MKSPELSRYDALTLRLQLLFDEILRYKTRLIRIDVPL